jgi:hypothetical protein
MFEYGVDTLLQLMIGYICGTMATDRRINCNIKFVKRSDGTYKMHFVPKKDTEQDDESLSELDEGLDEETHEELRVRGMSFDNQIGCDEIVQQFISGLSEYR